MSDPARKELMKQALSELIVDAHKEGTTGLGLHTLASALMSKGRGCQDAARKKALTPFPGTNGWWLFQQEIRRAMRELPPEQGRFLLP